MNLKLNFVERGSMMDSYEKKMLFISPDRSVNPCVPGFGIQG